WKTRVEYHRPGHLNNAISGSLGSAVFELRIWTALDHHYTFVSQCRLHFGTGDRGFSVRLENGDVNVKLAFDVMLQVENFLEKRLHRMAVQSVAEDIVRILAVPQGKAAVSICRCLH